MIGLNPLYLCAWHLIRLIIYRTYLQPKNKTKFEPEWVPEITDAIDRRIRLPFELVSVVLVYGCLVTTTSLSHAIIGSFAWWFTLSFIIPTINKITGHVDTAICSCSLLLYWWYAQDWNRNRQAVANTIEFQVLTFSSVMLGGIILMNLCMELCVFNRVLLTDDLVRVFRYYTLMFQIRINYATYVLLVFQPLSAIYGYFFISLPFVGMSFGIVLMIHLISIMVWNILVVNFFQYSKLQMPRPGTQRRIPDTFDYLLFYRLLALIHCAMFISLITIITLV